MFLITRSWSGQHSSLASGHRKPRLFDGGAPGGFSIAVRCPSVGRPRPRFVEMGPRLEGEFPDGTLCLSGTLWHPRVLFSARTPGGLAGAFQVKPAGILNIGKTAGKMKNGIAVTQLHADFTRKQQCGLINIGPH